ncbi:MAG: glycosyltransferase family 4 protein [Gammaproteobacteria bacterium]
MSSGRVLVITRNYPPLTGGIEKLSCKLLTYLGQHADCVLTGPAGAKEYSPDGVDVYECASANVGLFLLHGLINSFRAASAFKPDIIIAMSGVVAPLARLAARRANCRYAVLVHGLDIVANSAIYKKCFVPSICSADLVIANSANTRRLAVEHGVDPDRIDIVNPGVDLVGKIDHEPLFRIKHGLGDRPVILFVGRLIPRKGLVEFIRQALPLVIDNIPDAVFVISGSEPGQALLHKTGVLTEIRAAVSALELENNIIYTGALDDAHVVAAYQEADVFVFPVTKVHGDVEGFGMVALEAAANGLPVVAFDTDGVPDAVADGVSGYLIKPGDYVAMAARICELLQQDKNDRSMQDSCRLFAENFSWDKYGMRIMAAIDKSR